MFAQCEAKPGCSVTNVSTVEASQNLFRACLATNKPKQIVSLCITHSAPLGEKW